MATPAPVLKPPSAKLPITLLVLTVLTGSAFAILEIFDWETEYLLIFLHPLLAFATGAFLVVLLFWSLIAGLHSPVQAGRVAGGTAALLVVVTFVVTVIVSDRRIEWDYEHHHAQRMEIIDLVQQGKLLAGPLSLDRGQEVNLPAGYESVAHSGGVVMVWGDPQTHTVTLAKFYETRGCMGDCDSEYVYSATDDYQGSTVGFNDIRHLGKNWFWVEHGE